MAGVLVIAVIAVVSQTVTAQNRPAAQSGKSTAVSPQAPAAQNAPDSKNAQSAQTARNVPDVASPDSASTAAATTAAGAANGKSVENVNEKDLTFSDSAAPSPIKSVPAFGIWDLVRMVLILGFVVALIYGLFYLLKKGTGGRVNEASSMRVLGSLQLPGNRTIHLVEAGRQIFLVGGGEHSINLIAEITDQESLDDIRLKYQTATPGVRRNFSDLLSNVLAATGISTHQKNLSPTPTRQGAALTAETVLAGPASAGPPLERDSEPVESRGVPTDAEIGGIAEPTQFLRKQRDRLKRLSQ